MSVVPTNCLCCSAAELAIGNIVRRVLHMIREEQQQEQLEQSEGSSTPGDGSKGLQVRPAVLCRCCGCPALLLQSVFGTVVAHQTPQLECS
jgi:hypothetical protein